MTSFLDDLGVDDDSYFPAVRAYSYEDKVYGVCVDAVCSTLYVKEDVLGGTDVPSYEEFIDKLLNYPRDAIFWNGREYELTEENIADSRLMCESGRYLPGDNKEILNIIFEESESYFSGDKTKEQVCEIIQNRVQLLLNE